MWPILRKSILLRISRNCLWSSIGVFLLRASLSTTKKSPTFNLTQIRSHLCWNRSTLTKNSKPLSFLEVSSRLHCVRWSRICPRSSLPLKTSKSQICATPFPNSIKIIANWHWIYRKATLLMLSSQAWPILSNCTRMGCWRIKSLPMKRNKPWL